MPRRRKAQKKPVFKVKKKVKMVDPWPRGKWVDEKNPYSYHVTLYDKYSKNIPKCPAILKEWWGTSGRKGIAGYMNDTRFSSL